MKTPGCTAVPAWAQKEMDDFIEKLRAWRIRNVVREFEVNERRRGRESWMLNLPVSKK